MLKTNTLNFKRFEANDRITYNTFLLDEESRGCEFSFTNIFLWGEQSWCINDGSMLFFSRFGEESFYPFPFCRGEIKPIIDTLIADSKARGIPCVIYGIPPRYKREMESIYGDRFTYSTTKDHYDYLLRRSQHNDLG